MVRRIKLIWCNSLSKSFFHEFLIFDVLHTSYEQFMSIYIPADGEQLITMLEQIRDVFIIVS